MTAPQNKMFEPDQLVTETIRIFDQLQTPQDDRLGLVEQFLLRHQQRVNNPTDGNALLMDLYNWAAKRGSTNWPNDLAQGISALAKTKDKAFEAWNSQMGSPPRASRMSTLSTASGGIDREFADAINKRGEAEVARQRVLDAKLLEKDAKVYTSHMVLETEFGPDCDLTERARLPCFRWSKDGDHQDKMVLAIQLVVSTYNELADKVVTATNFLKDLRMRMTLAKVSLPLCVAMYLPTWVSDHDRDESTTAAQRARCELAMLAVLGDPTLGYEWWRNLVIARCAPTSTFFKSTENQWRSGNQAPSTTMIPAHGIKQYLEDDNEYVAPPPPYVHNIVWPSLSPDLLVGGDEVSHKVDDNEQVVAQLKQRLEEALDNTPRSSVQEATRDEQDDEEDNEVDILDADEDMQLDEVELEVRARKYPACCACGQQTLSHTQCTACLLPAHPRCIKRGKCEKCRAGANKNNKKNENIKKDHAPTDVQIPAATESGPDPPTPPTSIDEEANGPTPPFVRGMPAPHHAGIKRGEWKKNTPFSLPQQQVVLEALDIESRERHRRILTLVFEAVTAHEEWLDLPEVHQLINSMEWLERELTWDPSTTETNAAALQGAMGRLSQYLLGAQDMSLTGSSMWRDAMRTWSHRSRKAQKVDRPYMTVEQFHQTMSLLRAKDARALFAVNWAHAGRLSNTMNIEGKHVFTHHNKNNNDNKNMVVQIQWQEAKTVKSRGIYTTDSTIADVYASEVKAHFNKMGPGPMFPRNAAAIEIRTAMREVDPRLDTTRVMRRGALIAMASNGTDVPTLMKFSGHKRESTLMRYLDWGRHHGQATEAATRAAHWLW